MARAMVLLLVSLCLEGSAVAALGADESLAILPGKFTLNGSAARQFLLVEKSRGQQFVGQVTNDLAFSSSDTNVVRIEAGMVSPVTNGAATLRATVGNQVATTEVTVAD